MRSGWKRTIWMVSAIPWLVFAMGVIHGDDEVNPNVCVWKGTITLHRTGKGQPLPPRPEEGKTVIVSGSHTVSETITIVVCGDPEALYIQSVTRELHDDSSTEKTEDCHETLCMVPVQKRKRPGHHGTSKDDYHMKILQSLDTPKLRDHTSVRLSFPDPARFQIRASQTALADVTHDFVSQSHDVCTEKTKITEIHWRTGPPGSTHTSDRTGSDSHEIITHILPPLEKHKEFSFEAPYRGLHLKDSQVIDRIRTPEYEGIETVEWDLRGESPCPDVYGQLEQDLYYAEAYAEKKLSDFAGSIDEYNTLVEDHAYRMRYGVPAPRGEDSAETDAATDEQGNLSGLEKLKQKLDASCAPDMIYDSIYAHEDVHRRQKGQFPDFNDGNPRTYGLLEVSAYVIDAQLLYDWLRENCPGTDLTDAKRRLERLEPIASRYFPD